MPATGHSRARVGTSPKLFSYALAIYVAVVVGRIHESIPHLASLYPGKLAAGLLIVSIFLQRDGVEWVPALKSRSTRCVLAITVLGILSVPTSYWPKASVDFLTDQWPLVVLMMLAVTAGFANQRTAYLAIAAFTFAALVAALQLMLGAGLSMDGRAYIGGESSTYDPNYSAAFFVMALPYAVFFAGRRSKLRWIAIATIPCLVIATLKTVSRGGVVALAVVVIAMVLFAAKKNRKKYLVLIALGIGTLTFLPQTQLLQRFQDLSNGSDYNFTARDGRKQVWERGLQMMETHPLVGVGLHAYQTADGVISGSWKDAHNSFVQVGAELGVGGLVALVLAIIAAFKAGFRRRRELMAARGRDPDADRQLALALLTAALCSLIAEVTSAVFLSMAYEAMTLFAIAVPCGLGLAASGRTLAAQDVSRPNRQRMIARQAAIAGAPQASRTV